MILLPKLPGRTDCGPPGTRLGTPRRWVQVFALIGALTVAFWGWTESQSHRSILPEIGETSPSAPARMVQGHLPATAARAELELTKPAPTSPGLRILLLGSDSRSSDAFRGRPDALMVLVLPEEGSQVGVVSLPRDLWIVGAEESHRINETFLVAVRHGEPPLEAMERVVEDTLQWPIDHTVLVGMDGVTQVIDAVGGVEVEVPCPIVDNFLDPTSPSGRRRLEVEAGKQELSGTEALLYMRSRHGRSDFGRARRQQAVVRGLEARLASPAGLRALPRLLELLPETVKTSMTRTEMASLAWNLAQRDFGHVHGLVVGHPIAQPWTSPTGKAVLVFDREQLLDHVSRLFEAPPAGLRPAAAPCPAADIAVQKNWQ